MSSFLNACMFLSLEMLSLRRRSNLRLKITNGGDTCRDDSVVRNRLRTALSLLTADFVSAS